MKTIYCEVCSLIHDEGNCENYMESYNNDVDFIEKNEDAVFEIASQEGYLDGVLDDEMPEKISQYIVETPTTELVEKIRSYQESN